MACVLKQYSKHYLWQTIQTKEVRLTAEGLANNHTSKLTKKEKQNRVKNVLLRLDPKKVLIQAGDRPAEEVLQGVNNR